MILKYIIIVITRAVIFLPLKRIFTYMTASVDFVHNHSGVIPIFLTRRQILPVQFFLHLSATSAP